MHMCFLTLPAAAGETDCGESSPLSQLIIRPDTVYCLSDSLINPHDEDTETLRERREGGESCSRYSYPNAKPDFITACQTTAAPTQHPQRPTCFPKDSLSRSRFRIPKHTFTRNLSVSFRVNPLPNFVLLLPHKSDQICISKQAV
ncbi:uncharacterized protein V6R79_019157 [Siganus canaliculatus]